MFPPVLRPRSYQSVTIYRFFHLTRALEESKCLYFRVPLPFCALELTNVSLFLVFVLVFCFVHPTGALEVIKVSLLSCSPPILRPRSYQSVAIYGFVHPTCGLQVTKISLLSCSPPVLRPRSYQSLAIYDLFTRLAPSKLPKCRYFRVPLPSCALEVTKVSLFIIFLTRLRFRSYQIVATFVPPSRFAPSELPKCHYLLFFVSLFYRFSHPTRALEVTKVSLLSCSPRVLRPRSFQSVII